MNGKVVAVSEEGWTVVIEEKVTVTFENGKVIANGEAESKAKPSSAASGGEVVSEAIGQAITASTQRKYTTTEFICYSFVVGDGCFIPSAFDTTSVYTYPSSVDLSTDTHFRSV